VLGPIRIAQILAKVASPHRFRTKRQFWAYCGLAVVTRSIADYHFVEGRAAIGVFAGPPIEEKPFKRRKQYETHIADRLSRAPTPPPPR
jgi:transposase